jgi:hypothetical protein
VSVKQATDLIGQIIVSVKQATDLIGQNLFWHWTFIYYVKYIKILFQPSTKPNVCQSGVKLPHSVISDEGLHLNIENIVISLLITTIYPIIIHHISA